MEDPWADAWADALKWLQKEMREMLLEEERIALSSMCQICSWQFQSDPLFSPMEIVTDDWALYIQFPDGRMYVADLCTPIHDSLKEGLC